MRTAAVVPLSLFRHAPRIIDPATLCTVCGAYAAAPGALSPTGTLVATGWCRCCLANFIYATCTPAVADGREVRR